MCGIAGIVSREAGRLTPVVERMNQVQRHRGPNMSGLTAFPDAVLGHARLSILDLSEAGRQPMVSRDRRYAIVHNGEVYNYLELRRELGGDKRFRSGTDTEVILEAYCRWGEKCVERFVGMFAFAIWDSVERKLFVARDRFGIKPFYYAAGPDRLIFASEIKALLAAGWRRIPNRNLIREYLNHGFCDHNEETFFEGVCRLRPGYALTARPGEPPQVYRYYSLPDAVADLGGISEEEASRRLLEVLGGAVAMHLRSDVKVGVNVSGGLDSSTLLALVDRQTPDPTKIEVFTRDFRDPRYSERPWVEIMARQTRRCSTYSYMEPEEFWRAVEGMVWHQDEPFGGVPTTSWAAHYQATRARDVVVLLDGGGIDDIMAGYSREGGTFLADCFQAGDTQHFVDEFEGYLRYWGEEYRNLLQLVHRSYVQSRTSLSLDGTEPLCREVLSPDLVNCDDIGPEFPKPFESRLKNALYQGLAFTTIPRAQRYKDRVSMAFSRELRIPFLDHRLVEYCFSLPDRLLIKDGWPKYILRQAMKGILPDEVRLARKRSVQSPQREWFAGTLAPLLRDVLSSSSWHQRGYVVPERCLEMFERYCEGDRANSNHVWQWVNLELWHRMFIDPPELIPLEVHWPDCKFETILPNP
jgi:asparagine synthase (glutamine-hydrolysing)